MDDPRIAALAEALHIAEHQIDSEWWKEHPLSLSQDMDRHARLAAAILAALPPGWRTPLHHDPDMEERCDGRCARDECICSPEAYADEEQRRREIAAEIARLRRIEEAARATVDWYEKWNTGQEGEWWPVIDALRAALEEKP